MLQCYLCSEFQISVNYYCQSCCEIRRIMLLVGKETFLEHNKNHFLNNLQIEKRVTNSESKETNTEPQVKKNYDQVVKELEHKKKEPNTN